MKRDWEVRFELSTIVKAENREEAIEIAMAAMIKEAPFAQWLADAEEWASVTPEEEWGRKSQIENPERRL